MIQNMSVAVTACVKWEELSPRRKVAWELKTLRFLLGHCNYVGCGTKWKNRELGQKCMCPVIKWTGIQFSLQQLCQWVKGIWHRSGYVLGLMVQLTETLHLCCLQMIQHRAFLVALSSWVFYQAWVVRVVLVVCSCLFKFWVSQQLLVEGLFPFTPSCPFVPFSALLVFVFVFSFLPM